MLFCACILLVWSSFSAPSERNSQVAKLDIYVRNHANNYWPARWNKILSYFRYLIVKHPENDHMQYVLRWVIEDLDGAFIEEIEEIEVIEIKKEIKIEEKESEITPEFSLTNPGVWTIPAIPNNIDANEVGETRSDWVNEEIREPRGLDPISNNLKLRKTARDRSISLRKKWKANHKRHVDAVYYDYKVITKWFSDRGVVFKNVNWATSTENIWRARYSCDDKECTQEVIDSLRRIYDYFASEESYNGVHRRTMIHPEFKIVWVSFAIDESAWKIYGVMHYGTELK